MHVRLLSVLLLIVGFVSSAFAERAPIRHKRPNNTPVRHDTKFKAVPTK